MTMGFEAAHSDFIQNHIVQRTGERRGRLERGHREAEILFCRNVWCVITSYSIHYTKLYDIGRRLAVAASMARVIFSPTAEPMLPVKKSKLITATTTGNPPIVPSPVTTASRSPDFRACCASLVAYPGNSIV